MNLGKENVSCMPPAMDGSNTPYSKEELEKKISKIHIHLGAYEYDEAVKLSNKVLARHPNNCKALEMRASVATEMSDFNSALCFLNKAIAAEPFSGYSKYLAKAQISTDETALQCYQKAIELIKLSISQRSASKSYEDDESMDIDHDANEESTSNKEDEDETSLESDLSSVFCSIAELYLTDLCDEATAEESCINAIKEAVKADPSNAEAHITKARYEITVSDLDAAEETMKLSRSLWMPITDEERMKLLPSTQVTAAKALIELEMHDDAHTLLERVLEENDEVVEIYYLLGWNCYLQGKDNYKQAEEYLRDAKQTNAVNPCEDDQLLQHITELLQTLGVEEYSDDDGYEDVDDEELEKEILAHAVDEEDED